MQDNLHTTTGATVKRQRLDQAGAARTMATASTSATGRAVTRRRGMFV